MTLTASPPAGISADNSSSVLPIARIAFATDCGRLLSALWICVQFVQTFDPWLVPTFEFAPHSSQTPLFVVLAISIASSCVISSSPGGSICPPHVAQGNLAAEIAAKSSGAMPFLPRFAPTTSRRCMAAQSVRHVLANIRVGRLLVAGQRRAGGQGWGAVMR